MAGIVWNEMEEKLLDTGSMWFCFRGTGPAVPTWNARRWQEAEGSVVAESKGRGGYVSCSETPKGQAWNLELT